MTTDSVFASLPMYDFPEVRVYTDHWWQILRKSFKNHGFNQIPDSLDRNQSNKILWKSDALFMTQTCGYPLRFEYRNHLRPVSTPVYHAPGCENANYASAIVIHEDNVTTKFSGLSGTRLAANSPDSQSGFNAVRDLVIDENLSSTFFRDIQWTGSHRASLAALRDKTADVAAIDPVSLALVRQHASDEFAGLKILQFTKSVRGLPYAVPIATSDDTVNRLRDALIDATGQVDSAEVRRHLFLEGFIDASVEDYDAIVDMQARAELHPDQLAI